MELYKNTVLGFIMLRHLAIRHFALIDHLDLDLHTGTTALTGETGAGKSIMLDALALALGGRADSSVVASGQTRAEVVATVDLGPYPDARCWLQERSLQSGQDGEDDHEVGQECLLRRSINREGRSQAWINGHPVPVHQLRELGNRLIDIHAQHEHQSLLLVDRQRQLLDAFSGAGDVAQRLAHCYREWLSVKERLQQLSEENEGSRARRELLRYQIEELDNLALDDHELQALEQSQKELANAEGLLEVGQRIQQLCDCSDNDSVAVLDGLDQALLLIDSQKTGTRQLLAAKSLLEGARLQVIEALNEIRNHQDAVEVDPRRLLEVEQRLSQAYQVARKHRVAARELPALHRRLQEEQHALGGGAVDVSMLESRQQDLLREYRDAERQLSVLRERGASALAAAVNLELQRLNMRGSVFEVVLAPRDGEPNAYGGEQIAFHIATNPGQPSLPLRKVASGGELSRISLAIQVVLAQASVVPVLVFDEVDVGIGGDAAKVVGDLLRRLGETGQVICVTHQAAVAARAHHHWRVRKTSVRGRTVTDLDELQPQERIEEVARMLGGELSRVSCAHAELMLKAS